MTRPNWIAIASCLFIKRCLNLLHLQLRSRYN